MCGQCKGEGIDRRSLMALGIAAYMWQARRKAEWPFEKDIIKEEVTAHRA